ncbi:MAG: SDR family oxidoreductase [Candidatus Kapabacteria bacterium]|nr:SDR family oxidoreductase [Candidatus Kapabacteria bacterium]
MAMPDRLHVWITGAGRGIGHAVAQALAADHVLSISGRDTARLAEVVAHAPSGASITAHACDVRSEASVREAHDVFVASNGPVDVLINNAGIGTFRPLFDLTVDEFDEQIAVNLRGVFLCIKAVLPSMLERQRGQIVTVNSIAAVTAYTSSTAYGASKSGALALTRSLRNEVRDAGIKVHDLLVGATATDIWPDTARDEFGHRMMRPDDVAAVVKDLVADFFHPRTHIEELILRPQRGDL